MFRSLTREKYLFLLRKLKEAEKKEVDEEQFGQLKESIVVMEESSKLLMEQLSSLQLEYSEQLKQKDQYLRQIESLHQELEINKQQLEHQEQILQEEKHIMNIKDSQINQQKQEIEELNAQIKESQNQIEQITEAEKTSKRIIEEQNQKYEELMTQYSNIKALYEQGKEYNNELLQLLEQLKQEGIKQNNAEVQASLEELTKTLEITRQRESELVVICDSLQNKVDQFMKFVDDLTEEKVQVEEKFKHQAEENEELKNQLADVNEQIEDLESKLQSKEDQIEHYQERLQDISKELAVLQAKTDSSKYLKQLLERVINMDMDVDGEPALKDVNLDQNSKDQVSLLKQIINILQDSNLIQQIKIHQINDSQTDIIKAVENLIQQSEISQSISFDDLSSLFALHDIKLHRYSIKEEFQEFKQKVQLTKQQNEANFKSLQGKNNEFKQLMRRIEELEQNSGQNEMSISLIEAEVERQVSQYKAKYEQFKDFWKKAQQKEVQQLKKDLADSQRTIDEKNRKIVQLEQYQGRKQSEPKALFTELDLEQLQWE